MRIWEAATGSLLKSLENNLDDIASVTISPHGQNILSESRNKTMRIWDAADGSLLQTLEGRSRFVDPIASSLNSRSNTISINHHWIVINGRKALWLPFHRRPNCFDSLDDMLVIGSNFGFVTIIKFDLSKF